MDNQTDIDPDLAAIRDLIGEQGQRPVAQTPKSVRQKPVTQAKPARASSPHESKIRALIKSAFAATSQHLHSFLARPDAPRLMALAVIAGIFVWRPMYVIGLVLISLLVALIAYFSIGPDRVAQMIAAWFTRLKTRDPDRAEVLRSRAAKLSTLLGAVVDRLPERWTQGLYLPDFEEPSEQPPEMHDDPFDRLVPQSELS